MINVSNDFKTRTKKIKQQNIKLGILNGELTVKEVHFMPVNVFNKLPVWMLRKRQEVIAKELKYSFDGKLFKTIMKQIEITVKNAVELKDKNVNFKYGIYVNNKFEYIDLGDFYIKDIDDDKGKKELVVTGYDKMIHFMKTFKQSDLQLTYPCTMLTLIQKMCEVCGVELYSTDFFNADLQVDEDYFTAQELTYRDVLEKVAESTETTIFIKDNKLYLHKLADNPVEKLDASYLTGLTVKEKFGPVNALVLGRGDVEDNVEAKDDTSITQNGRCEIRFDENEFVEYKREQVIDEMFEQIKGLEYYAFEGSDVGVMWLEPCDLFEVEDNEESTYKTIYLTANITINTGIGNDIEADIPEMTDTEYKVTTKEEKKTLKVERLAKKNEGLIQDLIEETTEQGQKLTEVEQTVDGITQTVSEVETKIETVEDKADNAQETADNINTNLTQNYYTKTETNSQIQQTANSITSSVSASISEAKQEAIDSANSSTDDKLQNYSTTTEMNSVIEQKANEITTRIDEMQDITETVSGTKIITLENCVPGALLELHIYGNNQVFKYLYPSDDLYPSNNLYPYGDSRIIVSASNGETEETTSVDIYELGVTDVLRQNGSIRDEYVLKDGKAQVIRRINKDGTIKAIEEIEDLGEFFIELKDVENVIEIKNYSAEIEAKYAIQNDYTDIYATKVEMSSSIKQTSDEINLEVRKKVGKDEVISSINQSAEEVRN